MTNELILPENRFNFSKIDAPKAHKPRMRPGISRLHYPATQSKVCDNTDTGALRNLNARKRSDKWINSHATTLPGNH